MLVQSVSVKFISCVSLLGPIIAGQIKASKCSLQSSGWCLGGYAIFNTQSQPQANSVCLMRNLKEVLLIPGCNQSPVTVLSDSVNRHLFRWTFGCKTTCLWPVFHIFSGSRSKSSKSLSVFLVFGVFIWCLTRKETTEAISPYLSSEPSNLFLKVSMWWQSLYSHRWSTARQKRSHNEFKS